MSAPVTNLAADRLVISLDFGTTYSGVAYAFNVPGKKADIVPIHEWPGLEGYRQPKVPTLIMYDKNDPSKFKWGGQVTWREPAVHGVKLLLDPDQPKPKYLPASSFENDRNALDKDPVDVAADFLGAIYKHALSIVESSTVREYFRFCQKDFVLSVPAVWSDKAKDLTLKAAKKAGIHPVTLIKEPEAAALYTLSTYDHTITAGDSFVLCDAGGGTVDLITYQIKKILPYLELAELVPGDGGMAGSLGLNKLFEETVKDMVGAKQFTTLKDSVGWSKALNEFDKTIKTGFNGDTTDSYFVTFPMAKLEDNPAKGLFGNCWEMTSDILQGVFDPIIEDILQLVDNQVQAARRKRGGRRLKGIFLVGGFGSNRYLKRRLHEVYEPQGIQVIQPHDSWGAIVNGSALSRVSNRATVISTQAVRHYGVSSMCQFDPLIDQGRQTTWFPQHGFYMVEKLTWYIYKGEDLKRDQTIKFPFVRTLKQGFTPINLLFTDTLYYSEATVAPTYPGPQVKECCMISSNLIEVANPRNLVKRTGADGKIYYDLNFNLVISTAAANMKFSLEFKGQEMGSVEATYT
ncbi:hypothetical protein J7T55_011251 [Diaporthe amygdali]|uniref:uncharacterized protein n=1 Tax=Phomopsis amygdali TaxID=1214568 RepID=UPI0022FDCB07|nr:uncharacterized protein J7T55_011251 [Diaporthe amygdali]KAJ0108760.1 hypothetical protein J7T55_011251 [Diaporthe amygdali]